MARLSDNALKQLFSEARTYRYWLPQPITDEDLREITVPSRCLFYAGRTSAGF